MDVPPGSVTIRHAFPDDALALARLAALDSAEVPPQPMLLAEMNGELRAALSMLDGTVIADPFHRTAAFVQLLRARAEQLAAEAAATRRPAGRTRVGPARAAGFGGNPEGVSWR
jgi:hypothetical protein